ncbi:hypothetical protein BKA61DRAFT_55154 [Leptodontidium sp. MPI-SDFR-AT-0119]|nr:hypothetical protein BKA61DRAFT_55154 [Leptodontidium sp. MPI-SDFR-AT-0119]
MVALVIKDQAIPKTIAEAACRSLDKEIARQREEGALEAGKASSVKLEWTTQTRDVVNVFVDAFKASADLAPIQSLGGNPRGTLHWAGPIVYCDVLPEPNSLKFPSSALGYGIIGIIALGTLQLPEIGDNGPATIESGSVAYFRDSSPIVYRACKGRGIMFYIANITK